MRGFLFKFAVLFACLGLSGCGGGMGIPWPDMRISNKGAENGLSEKESDSVIKDLQKEKETHKEEAIKEIKSGS
ncbi:MAG: hypothetical protein ACRBBN_00535 [Methyloligellaceae bacterium]